MDFRPQQVLSLCAGAGGLDLGLRVAEPTARTVCYVEIEAFTCELLATRMEDKTMDTAPIWTDLRTFNGKPWRGKVDCITAGYPCQPFSVAGKQRAEKDPRHLWPEVYRIVQEIQPSTCFFENVGGHLRLGFEQVHDDLCRLGYRVKAGLFTAEEVGAPHKRERLFIMAYRQSDGVHRWLSKQKEVCRTHGQRYADESERSGETYMANCESFICQRPIPKRNQSKQSKETSGSQRCDMANTNSAGFQETRTQLKTTRISGKNSQLGNSEHAGSSTESQLRGNETPSNCGRSEKSQTSGELERTNRPSDVPSLRRSPEGKQLANPDCVGKQVSPSGEFAAEQEFDGNCYQIFPPTPDDLQLWGQMPDSLKPAVCRVADGLANRVDRIRTCGNGVVPLVAAYAWSTLKAAATKEQN